MRIRHLSLLLLCCPVSIMLSAQSAGTENSKAGSVRYKSPCGFCFSLPENWKGFSIIAEHWQGYTSCSGVPTDSRGPDTRSLRDGVGTGLRPWGGQA